MAFRCNLMADPVVASDGFTYERDAIEQWLAGHDVSPVTNVPLDHKHLTPNVMARQQIAAWCEHNGVPVPRAPKSLNSRKAACAAVSPLHKPVVACASHADEQLRFSVDGGCAGRERSGGRVTCDV